MHRIPLLFSSQAVLRDSDTAVSESRRPRSVNRIQLCPVSDTAVSGIREKQQRQGPKTLPPHKRVETGVSVLSFIREMFLLGFVKITRDQGFPFRDDAGPVD